MNSAIVARRRHGQGTCKRDMLTVQASPTRTMASPSSSEYLLSIAKTGAWENTHDTRGLGPNRPGGSQGCRRVQRSLRTRTPLPVDAQHRRLVWRLQKRHKMHMVNQLGAMLRQLAVVLKTFKDKAACEQRDYACHLEALVTRRELS